ncbi:long-chain fatty acid--CoA ligase [Kordiimonas sp. SCSIO 12610]|uniref:acyl-CoA synthetase n=1 Tax=Kordiimonas sp. SCSIO 12610 TaxID=2829597 RepID=UPI0021088CCE|nr:long-chain fatty acid--CoA ligase [Kordiimonas sp. SCSIO 12610]UTW54762.1 long-chain fatty acid--CoA ligase [Kordiimonas sp. SCSIO 12610]
MMSQSGSGQDLVFDWISYNAANHGARTAQVDIASGRTYTYLQMHDRVGRLAAHLKELGVRKGDRVGLLAMNSTDMNEVVFACWRIGAVCLMLNFRLTAPELEYIINDASPDVVVFDTVFEPTVDIVKPLVSVKHWIDTDGVGGDSSFERSFSEVSPINDMIGQFLSDTCMLMYSSGTTGRPKGVVITYKMLLFSVFNFVSSVGIAGPMVNLAVMPLFHIGGFNIFNCPAMYLGGTTLVMRSFDPESMLEYIGNPEHGVTHFIGVPAMYNAMRQHPKAKTADFSNIQVACAGGEAVPVDIIRWWSENGLTVQQGLGMTENAASCTFLPPEQVTNKEGSVGVLLRHSEGRIVDPDGVDVGVNQTGELWLRGPTVTPAYWNRADANEQSFVDGWLRTGDIVRRDKDGYLYVEDRVKDMYISGGENVYPAEVENILYQMPEILEVAVVGVKDQVWGETGCAFVVVKEDADLSLLDLQSFCSDKLAKYKHPNRIERIDVLPRNATGKVLKYQLRDQLKENL